MSSDPGIFDAILAYAYLIVSLVLPDLGKYGDAVLSAYSVSVVMLLALVALSIRASVKSKRLLDVEEEKMRKNGR